MIVLGAELVTRLIRREPFGYWVANLDSTSSVLSGSWFVTIIVAEDVVPSPVLSIVIPLFTVSYRIQDLYCCEEFFLLLKDNVIVIK